jgi:hypothetical protein
MVPAQQGVIAHSEQINSKHQARQQIPSTKHQIPNKQQTARDKENQFLFVVCCIGICLFVWDLEFVIWDL